MVDIFGEVSHQQVAGQVGFGELAHQCGVVTKFGELSHQLGCSG